MKLIGAVVCGALLSLPAVAMAADPVPLDVPAKTLPVPTADISPGMQKFIGAPLNPNWNKLWKTGEEARAFADAQAADTVKTIPAMLERLHVNRGCDNRRRLHSRPRAAEIPPENRDKVPSTSMAAVVFPSPGIRHARGNIMGGRRTLGLSRLSHAAQAFLRPLFMTLSRSTRRC